MMASNTVKKTITRVANSFGYHFGILPPAHDVLPRHLADLFQLLDINCVLDVGAHHGEFASRLRGVDYKGRIISWEPVNSSFQIVSEAASVDPDWTVHNYALGAESQQLEISVMNGTATSSFLAASDYGKEQLRDKLTPKARELVEVKRLADVFNDCVAGLPKVNVFLKVDAQGYDLQVVKGAGNCLRKIAALQLELSVKPIYEGVPTYTEAIAELNGMGFELSGLFPVRIDHQMRLIEIDCVMVRRSVV